MRRIVAAALICALASGVSHGQSHGSIATASVVKQQALPVEIEEILWWLPAETETFVVSRGLYRPSGFLGDPPRGADGGRLKPGELDASEVRSVGEALSWVVAADLSCCSGNKTDNDIRKFESQYLNDGKLKLAAMAVLWNDAENNRETCSIFRFKDDLAQQFFARSMKTAVAERTIGRFKVLEYRDRAEPTSDIRHFLMCPRGDTIWCATSARVLQAMAERFENHAKARALPEDLPEWKYLNTQSEQWAVRHFLPESKAQATSMLRFDPDAVGMVLFSDDKPTPSIAIRYVSSSDSADKRFKQMLESWSHQTDSKPKWMPPIATLDATAHELRLPVHISNDPNPKPFSVSLESRGVAIITLVSGIMGVPVSIGFI